jgi:hypothetical protein
MEAGTKGSRPKARFLLVCVFDFFFQQIGYASTVLYRLGIRNWHRLGQQMQE